MPSTVTDIVGFFVPVDDNVTRHDTARIFCPAPNPGLELGAEMRYGPAWLVR